MPYKDKNNPRARYFNHKARAKRRGIPFLLTFDEWWKIWQDSGHWEERGIRKGQYVMCRKGPDIGAYEIGNIFIATNARNLHDANVGRKQGEKSPVAKLSNEDVIAIKKELQKPFWGIQTKLAQKYGVSPVAISDIRCGRKWTHLTVD
jgi:hypothetical protein